MDIKVDLSIPESPTDDNLKHYSLLQIAFGSILLLVILGAGVFAALVVGPLLGLLCLVGTILLVAGLLLSLPAIVAASRIKENWPR